MHANNRFRSVSTVVDLLVFLHYKSTTGGGFSGSFLVLLLSSKAWKIENFFFSPADSFYWGGGCSYLGDFSSSKADFFWGLTFLLFLYLLLLLIGIINGFLNIFAFSTVSLLFYIVTLVFLGFALYFLFFAYIAFRMAGGIHGGVPKAKR